MKPKNNSNYHQDEILLPSKDGYVVIPAPDIRRPQIETQSEEKRPSISTRRSFDTIKNMLHFAGMLVAMIAILGYLGFAIGGWLGFSIIIAITAALFFGSSHIKIEHFLKLKKLTPIFPEQSRELYDMIGKLISKSGLSIKPMLFFSHSPEMGAYTLQDSEKAAIVVTGGLLNNLNRNEIYAVLAHEMAHLKNNDVKVMLMAKQIHKITGFLALAGQILLLLNLPLIFLNQLIVPWSLILILIGAPFINLLLTVAISRNREYQADLDAALLSGDPLGLASALQKIGQLARYLKWRYAPFIRNVPEILRSHPNTSDRIRRLKTLHREVQLSY